MLRPSHLTAVVATAFAAASSGGGDPRCEATEVEYVLAANLQLSDTPLGQGDGVYPIGPGRTLLRFQGREVRMLSYTMYEHFAVRARTLFWTTTVTTDAWSKATPDACSVAAEGSFDGKRIHWRTPVREYRTDGTLTCSGAFCGQFGAPPPGRSELHIGPAPQRFNDFVFSADGKTFTMERTAGPKTEMPKQSSAVAVSGREARRACVFPPPCGK